MVGVENLGLDDPGRLLRHFRSHGVGQVHRKESDVDGLEILHLGTGKIRLKCGLSAIIMRPEREAGEFCDRVQTRAAGPADPVEIE